MAKVGFVTDSLLDGKEIFAGGAERHLFQLARLATEHGAAVTVYQPGRVNGQVEIDGIRVVRVPTNVRGIWRLGSGRAIADGCSYLHYQHLGAMPLQRIRKPTTATMHGIWWDYPVNIGMRDWYPLGGLTLPALPIWRWAQSTRSIVNLARCTAVLTVDTSFLRIVQSQVPELRERVHVALNFCDLTQPEDVPADIPILAPFRRAHEAGKLVVLVPRNLSLARGASWLCSIVEETTRLLGDTCEFFIAGQVVTLYGRGGVTARVLNDRIQDMSSRARSNLTFLGGIPHEAMAQAYRESDVVLIPTYCYEGSALAAVEAMSLGRPVVATNIGGLNDVIADGWTGLLVGTTIEGIVGALERLSVDPAFRCALGERARIEAAGRFTLARWRERVVPFMTASGWLS